MNKDLGAVLPFSAATKGAPLLRQAIEQRGLRQREVAEAIGMSVPYVSLMLKEERPITAAIARKLANHFGGSAEDWMTPNVQRSRLDAANARAAVGQIVGSELEQLCSNGNVLRSVDMKRRNRSSVTLRIAENLQLIAGVGEERITNLVSSNFSLALKNLVLNHGDRFFASTLEFVSLPEGVSATLYLHRLRISEGFQAPTIFLEAGTCCRPDVMVDYKGSEPRELKAEEDFFSIRFERV